MLKAKTRMIERDSEAFTSEVFAVADNITPIAIASVDSILKLEDTEDLQVVPEQKVKQLIVENKSTNPMSKFFVRLGTYLDSMENFLSEMHSNYMKAVEQKRSLHGLEDSDQKRKTARAKRTARKLAVNKFLNSFKFSGKQDLYDMPLGLMVMNFLRGGFDDRIADQAESIVIVPYKPVAGQLKAKGETEDQFVSGYKLTSAYGYRWGKMHGGVDIGVPIGTMFALKKKSVIKFVGYQDPDNPSVGYGLLVDAWVPSLGKMFRFGHLSEVAVEEGDNVAAGKVLGKSGNTGVSTGPHFHIEVHPEVRPDYGGENPMPYIDYVIAGDEMMEQKSEGSIERVGRVMVGEAGTEFVIPMSQMPIFAQLMMEEKIKSLNPLYTSPIGRFDNLGVERQSGFTNTMMSAGAIIATEKKIKTYEALGAYTPGTGRGGRLADYITIDGQESIISGTPRSVAFNPNTRLYSYIDSQGYPTIGWGSTFYGDIFSGGKGTEVRDGDTTTVGRANQLFKDHVRQLYDGYNETYPLWKHFTDKQVAGLLSYYYNRGVNVGFTLGIHREALKAGDMKTLADDIEQDTVNVGPARRRAEADLIRSGPSKIVPRGRPKTPPVLPISDPAVQRQIEKNLRDRNTMSPEDFFGTKPVFSSSLNSIPGNEQMQIANETQEQFSLGDVKGEIVALYQPTVYYTES